jgi:hypothetical protein
MKFYARPFLLVAVAAAVLVSAGQLGALGLEAGLPRFVKEAERSWRLEDECARQSDACLRRSRESGAIARDVLDGRLPLAEGSAQFRALMADGWDEQQWRLFRLSGPGVGDDERFCRVLIRLAAVEARLGPDVAHQFTAADLEAQRAALFRE